MRKHLNQHVISPMWWVLIIFIVLLLAMTLLLMTPLGPKTAAQIASYSVKQLSLKGVSGTFFSGVHVDKFIWDDGNSIVINNLDVKLNKYDLENGGMAADFLKVGSLDINLEAVSVDPETNTEVEIPDFGLPLNIDAELVSLKQLRITKEKFAADDVKAKAKNTAKNDDGTSFDSSSSGQAQNESELLDVLFEIHDLQLEKLSIKDHMLHFGRLQGNPIILNEPLKINVTDGNLNMDRPHDMFTRGTASFKHPDLGFAEGDIDLKGTLTHYQFSSILNVRQEQLGEQTLTIVGNGDYSQVSFDAVDLKGDSGELKGTAKVDWDPEIQWVFKGNVKSLDTTRWTPGWPVKANAKLEYHGSFASESSEVSGSSNILKNELNLISLTGSLKNKSKVTVEGLADSIKLSAKGRITTVGDKISTQGLELDVGKNQLKVTGVASEPMDLSVKIRAPAVKQLYPDLAGELNGSAKFAGGYTKPEISVNLTANKLVYQDFKQGSEALVLTGEMGLQGSKIRLKDMSLKTGENEVSVSGDVSEPLKLSWKIDAKKLTQVSPDLRGSIQGDGDVSGSYKSPLIKANIRTAGLRFKDIEIGKSPIQAIGEVQLQDGVPIVKNLIANSGSNRVIVTGRASSPFDLNWNIEGNNLNELLTGLSGRLQAKGQLQGTIDQPVINATADAKNIQYEDFRIDSGDFVASTRNGRYQINGKLKQLDISGQKFKSAKVDASGVIENHSMDVSFDHNDATVKISARGGWQNERWQGSLQQFEYADAKLGKWALQSPVQISASQESMSASRFCLRNGKSQACSVASWTKANGINAQGQLQNTSLALLQPLLPDGMVLNGNVEGDFDIKQSNGRPKGTVKIMLPDSSFSFKDADGEEQTFSYQDASLNATIDDKTIVTNAKMEIVNRGKFSAKATIKLSPEDGRHTIDGSAQLDVPNIYWAQDFIPRTRGLRGVLESNLSVSGLLSKPKIVGKATLKNGYLRLPEAGTELSDINLNVVADKPGQAVISGKMLMGKGVLNVNGDLDIKDIAKWKANVTVKGNNILFMNTNEIQARMTPDISIQATPEIFAITGKVVIPEANINLKDIPETSIDESDDVVVVGEKQKGEQVIAVKIRPDVVIELGDKIKVNAFGLKAKLSGDVRVTHNRREILAQGSLRVTEGKYQAYGQSLDINNGRLIFNGSPKIVGMDIRATRQIDEQLVGIHLGGTVLNPKSTIYSDPVIPESEALSLLLTGHNLDSASGQESALLMSAVRGLGVSGGDSMLGNIGSSLGLDDVNIVTKADFRQSELALGKRLGPKLYVRYMVGLFDQTQKIAVDYKINKMLSLQAEVGVISYGLDLIYRIERD